MFALARRNELCKYVICWDSWHVLWDSALTNYYNVNTKCSGCLALKQQTLSLDFDGEV